MIKSFIKDFEILDKPIKGLMVSSNTPLELSDGICIKSVSDTADWLSFVATVCNHLLARQHFALEAIRITKHGQVILCRLEWAIQPDKLVFIDCDANLIGKASLLELV